MLKRATGLVFACVVAASAIAQTGPVPTGVPFLDHAFVIMMENHGYYQVYQNPHEPVVNNWISHSTVNLAKNYFAIGHPSLTNYLEIVGGSNFGIRSDNPPNWGSTTCTPNMVSGIVNADDGGGPHAPGAPATIDTGEVCPISGTGKDAATPAVDTWNEVGGPFVALADIDGTKSYAAASVAGMTIADQLAQVGLQWKSYQESIPLGSVYGIDYSNGFATNLSNITGMSPTTQKAIVQLYAVKHNPFAYFKSIQDGTAEGSSLANVAGFNSLYVDLATGDVPAFSFIVPNQCDDEHGRGNADAFCAFDYGSDPPGSGYTYGTLAGLNPGLTRQGDDTLNRIVQAIKGSPAWKWGRNAIVVVWDENDYSGVTSTTQPFTQYTVNNVVLTVETNYSKGGVQSNTFYNSFSLLKSLESAFGLPCLNHACDSGVAVMSDLFGGTTAPAGPRH